MCVLSMVVDHYSDKWEDRNLWRGPYMETSPWTTLPEGKLTPMITEEEIEELRKLLGRAREYDKKNSEPDCESKDKIDRLKKILQDMKVSVEIFEKIIGELDDKSV